MVSRRHPSHRLSSKEPNYQRGVLLISAGAIEGHFGGKTPQEVHQDDNAPGHRALATHKEMALLGFQCLDHPTYSPDLSPFGLPPVLWTEKTMKIRLFSSDAEVIAAAETWMDGQASENFLSGLHKLEQRAKKCIVSSVGIMLNKSRVWLL